MGKALHKSVFSTKLVFMINPIFAFSKDMAIGNDSENPVHTIQDASFLLSIVGGANTLSRVVLGYLSDKAWMNRLYLYNGALTVCGIGNLSKTRLNVQILKRFTPKMFRDSLRS